MPTLADLDSSNHQRRVLRPFRRDTLVAGGELDPVDGGELDLIKIHHLPVAAHAREISVIGWPGTIR